MFTQFFLFAAIQEALESRDVGRTAIRWTANMLKCRNIQLTYQGESVEARVGEGLPTRRSIVTSAVVNGC